MLFATTVASNSVIMAVGPGNWTQAGIRPCLDTGVVVSSPNAKRLLLEMRIEIVSQQGHHDCCCLTWFRVSEDHLQCQKTSPKQTEWPLGLEQRHAKIVRLAESAREVSGDMPAAEALWLLSAARLHRRMASRAMLRTPPIQTSW